jgi:hypothetical protein
MAEERGDEWDAISHRIAAAYEVVDGLSRERRGPLQEAGLSQADMAYYVLDPEAAIQEFTNRIRNG